MIKICDAHCDTISKLLDNGQSLAENTLHLSLDELCRQNFAMQFFACWISPEYGVKSFERCNSMIDKFYDEYSKNADRMHLVKSAQDIDTACKEGKLASLLTIEGGEALGGDIDNLHYFFDRGVRLLTLTWNGKNEIADGIFVDNAKGLTEFGKAVVKTMNRMGMIIDVSHLSEQGFWDVAELSKAPFMATHSNARKLCGHRRNLTDEQIRFISEHNGFIGVNFCPDFLDDNKPTVDGILKHIEYILSFNAENVVGFGADFDGIDDLPAEINGVLSIGAIVEKMLSKGYNEALVKAIAGGNLMRATKEIMNFFNK